MPGIAYQSLPSKVVFGKGALVEAPSLAAALGCKRLLLISTPSQAGPAARLRELLGAAAVASFDRAAMHTPVEVTDQAMSVVNAERIDGTVCVGGGSAIGLGKAIALRTGLPQISVPTTYAGSELTPVVGQTEAGSKTTQRSDKVLPRAVIYDVDLTLSLPVPVSVVSGFNAIAHAVEALWSKAPTPLLLAAAEDCVRSMAHALPHIVLDPADEEARTDALGAAWLGGFSLANGGSALHHRLCHVLGGAFGLPHAETHTVLLPHVIAYNAAEAPGAIARLERALNSELPAAALHDLAESLGAPISLRELGMPEAGIRTGITAVLGDPPWNPRPLERRPLLEMLRRAYLGHRPLRA